MYFLTGIAFFKVIMYLYNDRVARTVINK